MRLLFKFLRVIILLLRRLFRAGRNSVRNSIRRISRPDSFFSDLGDFLWGDSCEGGGGGFGPGQEQEQDKLWEDYLRNQFFSDLSRDNWGLYFSYGWGAYQHLDDKPENHTTEKTKKNLWAYMMDDKTKWYYRDIFNRIHNPYRERISDFEQDLHLFLETSIDLATSIKDFFLEMNQTVCKMLAFINHWKFLREELYSILNLLVGNNPISAYVTHTCALNLVNTPLAGAHTEIEANLHREQHPHTSAIIEERRERGLVRDDSEVSRPPSEREPHM